MNKQECIKRCSFQDGIIKLPDVQLDRKVYVEVKKTLVAIGAKWKGGKTQGFALSDDKVELFSRVQNDPDYNYLKDTKFFETPPEICQLIKNEILAIYCPEMMNYLNILEPSAGRGALLDVIKQCNDIVQIKYCEKDSYNKKVLRDIHPANLEFICDDFLKLDEGLFHLIVANPPFNMGRAQKHLLKMIDRLDMNGNILCVMPENWRKTERWSKKFEFLDTGDYGVYEINCPEKAFEHTNISTVIVVIQSLT